MTHADLPLFAWQPPVKLLAFPLVNRVGKIRDVAVKLMDKTTERHANSYRDQVTVALIRQLEKIGLSEMEVDEQLGAFWEQVRIEMIRLASRGYGSGGGAA